MTRLDPEQRAIFRRAAEYVERGWCQHSEAETHDGLACSADSHSATEVPPERLMCRPHWRMVPSGAKRRVLTAYRPGQCADKRPSKEWRQAAHEAIRAVRTKEVSS